MKRRLRLEPLLKNAVALAMVSPASVIGCGGDDDLRHLENEPGFVRLSCETPEKDVLDGLTPEPPVDFIESRPLMFQDLPTNSTGEQCGSATDKTACAALVANATSTTGFFVGQCVQLCPEQFWVVNRGDQVFTLASASSVTSFLGRIDTPEEAILVAQLNGFEVPCDRGGAAPIPGGFDVQAFTHEGCDGSTRHIVRVTSGAGRVELGADVEREPNPNCVVGRRPPGLRSAPTTERGSPVARYLAGAATLEAASVHAFKSLARELTVHRAPKRLVTAALRAARDEVRHARVTARLARRFGSARFRAPRVEALATRDLEAIAVENAAEGCVRETFGAAVGIWQARHAADPVVKRVMRDIARDETRHAKLAWAIDAWLEGELAPAAARRVEEARREAISALRSELRQEYDVRITEALGVPRSASALHLHATLERTLWSRRAV